MQPVHEFEIYRTVYSYAKIYNNMTKLFEFNHPSKIRKKGYEARKKRVKMNKNSTPDPVSVIDSLRRTKTRLSDIVVSNDFDLFCTFTFAEDRQNVDKCKSKMSVWLNNQQKRVGEFDYVIVPEFHKDGKSIHFHALFKGYKGKLEKTKLLTPKTKQRVYNIPGYKAGFSTAVKIDDIEAVGSYIKKYITKDMPQFNGKKRYWCSQGLSRPKKITNPVVFESDRKHFTEEHQMNNMRLYTANKKIDLTESLD